MKIKLLCSIKAKNFKIPVGTILEECVDISSNQKGWVNNSQVYRTYRNSPLSAPFVPDNILDGEDYEVVKDGERE